MEEEEVRKDQERWKINEKKRKWPEASEVFVTLGQTIIHKED